MKRALLVGTLIVIAVICIWIWATGSSAAMFETRRPTAHWQFSMTKNSRDGLVLSELLSVNSQGAVELIADGKVAASEAAVADEALRRKFQSAFTDLEQGHNGLIFPDESILRIDMENDKIKKSISLGGGECIKAGLDSFGDFIAKLKLASGVARNRLDGFEVRGYACPTK